MANHWTVYESPLGPLTLTGSGARLSGLYFPDRGPPLPKQARDEHALAPALRQLDQYFAGERRSFELELELHGNPFKQAVWRELRGIPYGSTVTYKEIATRIGRLDRIRAVGGAVGATPVPIVVPCHRVVGSDGSLTGYGGGLERKQALLELEGARRQLSLV
jgi:methylated-DNA-[protein]-cysteine S-methyltransferase